MRLVVARVGLVMMLACVSPGCSGFRTGSLADVIDAPAACGREFVACNPWADLGCAVGQACVLAQRPDLTATASCVAPGSGRLGSRCASVDACERGLSCVANFCRRPCCSGDDLACRAGPEGTPMASCSLSVGSTATDVMACLRTCDWVGQDCPGSSTCIQIDAMGRTDCVESGSELEGNACERTSQCTRGLLCARDPRLPFGSCRRMCDLRSPTCLSGTTCRAIMGGASYLGTCLP